MQVLGDPHSRRGVFMASDRNKFIFRLHLIGLTAAAIMTAAATAIIVLACPLPDFLDQTQPVFWGPPALLALGVVIQQLLVRLLLGRVLKPTGQGAMVAC